jgi:tRNA 2-selenouridine synthase
MRSAAVAELFSEAGMNVIVIEGGYKAYRRHMLQILEQRWPLVILGGRTGSRKTDILHKLRERGEQVIDLEAIANHRGSAFGALGQPPQPSSEMAMNLVGEGLRTFSKNRTTFIEDESLRIGSVVLHAPLYEYMQSMPIIVLDIPRKERAEYLATVYGESSTDDLIERFERIRKRLGGERTQRAIDLLSQHRDAVGEKRDALVQAVTIALEYYDPTYDYAVEQRDPDTVVRVDGAGLGDDALADLVQDAARQQTFPGKGGGARQQTLPGT